MAIDTSGVRGGRPGGRPGYQTRPGGATHRLGGGQLPGHGVREGERARVPGRGPEGEK